MTIQLTPHLPVEETLWVKDILLPVGEKHRKLIFWTISEISYTVGLHCILQTGLAEWKYIRPS